MKLSRWNWFAISVAWFVITSLVPDRFEVGCGIIGFACLIRAIGKALLELS